MPGYTFRMELFAQDTKLCAAVTTDTSYLIQCSALLVDDTPGVFDLVLVTGLSRIQFATNPKFFDAVTTHTWFSR